LDLVADETTMPPSNRAAAETAVILIAVVGVTIERRNPRGRAIAAMRKSAGLAIAFSLCLSGCAP